MRVVYLVVCFALGFVKNKTKKDSLAWLASHTRFGASMFKPRDQLSI